MDHEPEQFVCPECKHEFTYTYEHLWDIVSCPRCNKNGSLGEFDPTALEMARGMLSGLIQEHLRCKTA